MQWQRGTRYLGKRRQRNHRRIAFGSLTGLISGFVLTLAVSLVVLGAADGEAGLRLSIPGIKHAPATSDAGSHSKTTSDVAAVPGSSPSVDVTASTRGRTTGGVPTAGSTAAASISGASHPATSRPGQPVVAVTSQRSTAKPTGSSTGGAAPSAPATSSAPSVPVTTTTTQAPPPPEPSASASEPATDPVAPAGAAAGG